MNTIETLTKARAYIEQGFCRDTWAKSEKGKHLMPGDPGAVCWCLDGAVQTALCKAGMPDDEFMAHRERALRALLRVRGPAPENGEAPYRVHVLSDKSDQQGVLQWIDEALLVLKETENEFEKD